jgi:hypothetical protein
VLCDVTPKDRDLKMNAESIYMYLSVYLSMALQPFVGPWPPPLSEDQPVARLLPAHRTAQTQNKFTQISMPLVGFEHTIPVLERAKTVHALGRVATVIGAMQNTMLKSRCSMCVFHQCYAGTKY